MCTNLWQMLMFSIVGWFNEHQQVKLEFALELLQVYKELTGGKRLRLNDDQRRRLAAKGKKLGLSGLRELVTMVTPETIMRWHRELVAKKYDGSERRRPGRPRIDDEIRSLIVRMASVKRILKDKGIEPAPERVKHMPWSKFLKVHWDELAAVDFFTIEVWTSVGLVRHLVFFVIDLPTRRVEIAGIAPIPDGLWMEQIARNLVDAFSGFLHGKTHLIHDRDPLFTRAFRQILKSSGVDSVRLPARSPNLNAYAERFVLSIKSECLDRMVLVGEQHLRRAVNEYVAHYHLERTHQGLGNELIDGVSECSIGRVLRRERLGGLLSSYYREAA